MNLRDIANLNIHSFDYLCIINGIHKCKAIALLHNGNLNEKSGILQNIKIYYQYKRWIKNL